MLLIDAFVVGFYFVLLIAACSLLVYDGFQFIGSLYRLLYTSPFFLYGFCFLVLIMVCTLIGLGIIFPEYDFE